MPKITINTQKDMTKNHNFEELDIRKQIYFFTDYVLAIILSSFISLNGPFFCVFYFGFRQKSEI